jgi:hypothetical protein
VEASRSRRSPAPSTRAASRWRSWRAPSSAGPLSARTYAEIADEVGVPLEFVLAFEEALGKVRPAPDDPAPSDLEALLEAPRVAMDAGVIDDRTHLRLIGVYADAAPPDCGDRW